MKKLLVIASAFVLIACGGGSGSGKSNQENKSIEGIPSSFIGVWDASTDEGVDGFDEFYVVIDAAGIISSYDFAGDTFDDWGNCYWVRRRAFYIQPLGGSKYLSTAYYPGELSRSSEVEIKVSNGTLTISGKDVYDSDDDGNTTESYIDTMRKTTRTVQSFTPECVDLFSVARSLIPAKQQKSLNLAQ